MLRPVITVCVALGSPVGALHGQTQVDASGLPACVEACIAVELVQTIPSPDSVALDRADVITAVVDGTGRTFLAPAFLPGRVLMFVDGRHVETIGRYGEGPGEAERVSHLALGRGDSLHVFRPLARNVFGPSAEFVRYQRDPVLPMQSNVRLGATELHVANAPGRARARPPVLQLPAGGLGPGESPVVLDDPGEDAPPGERRLLDRTSSECVAVGRAGEYRIDVYDGDLALERTVRRHPAWFEPWSDWEPPTEEPPKPRLMSVMAECDVGILWAVIAVAEDEGFMPLDVEDRRAPLPRENRTYDTVVEVIDWTSGEVLASRRFDGTLGPLQSGGHVLEPFVGEDGEQQFRVLRLTLRSR